MRVNRAIIVRQVIQPVLFSGHGVAFFVICVISRVLIRKRIYILLSDEI
jgi:hypothetical protein